jgi:hypothetical protein
MQKKLDHKIHSSDQPITAEFLEHLQPSGFAATVSHKTVKSSLA